MKSTGCSTKITTYKAGKYVKIWERKTRGYVLAHLLAWYWQRSDQRSEKDLILIKPCNFAHVVPSSEATLNSGVTMNSHTPYMETHWTVPITATSQYVCVLDCSLKVSMTQSQKFWNVPRISDLKQQFLNKKI